MDDQADDLRREFDELRQAVLFALTRVREIQDDQVRQVAALRGLVQQVLIANHARRPGTGPLWVKANQRWAKRLVALIRQYFDDEDVQELLFDFDLSYADFKNGGRRASVRRLVLYFYNRGTLGELALYCQQMRPAVVWPLTAMEVRGD